MWSVWSIYRIAVAAVVAAVVAVAVAVVVEFEIKKGLNYSQLAYAAVNAGRDESTLLTHPNSSSDSELIPLVHYSMGNRTRKRYHLGGGFNPFEKILKRKGSSNWISNSPGIRVKFSKKCAKPPQIPHCMPTFFPTKSWSPLFFHSAPGFPLLFFEKTPSPGFSHDVRILLLRAGAELPELCFRSGEAQAAHNLEGRRTWRCDFKGRGRPLVGTVGVISPTLRIAGPCYYRGVWMCIAGVWDLQTTSFEIPWFLGYIIKKGFCWDYHPHNPNFFLLTSNRTSKYSLALRISHWTLQWKGWFETAKKGVGVYRVQSSKRPVTWGSGYSGYFQKKWAQNIWSLTALRIMGSQNWWFGDPRRLLYISKPLKFAGSSDS